ncbi:5-bromo-4-chloroindolyl phosphate hydrolysis family protein [uncultured Dubosiella sp.]|uniref:5-bromo-4-chloroindolyl phosphate hydrolysis family protein n=1 Tax=uncultured Dubosiella sp. TaxID=1937011 RepID=UPI0025B2C6E8|nr:5-bromo-4-chloroindolyl phosphate hydrolysis family protein [uncultured Dubosiella sp.]
MEKRMENEKERNANYFKETKEVFEVVNYDSFDEIVKGLDQLPNVTNEKVSYVFGYDPVFIGRVIILVCVLLIMALLWYGSIFTATLIYSTVYADLAFTRLLILASLVLLNLLIIGIQIAKFRFAKRYTLYVKDLRFKHVELIDDLSAFSKIRKKQIIKDLKRAVRWKLIPQGHFGTDHLFFMVSDELYDEYIQNQAAYDRYYKQMLDERSRMGERTQEIQNILDQGHEHVKKIKECNDIIKDKAVSKKLDHMESVVSMIFYEVDVNPQYANQLRKFMNYYLPTTEKLLETYIEIGGKKIRGKSLNRTKKDIETALDKINESFDNLLDQFYEDRELDIRSDISTMEVLMKQDGLSDAV